MYKYWIGICDPAPLNEALWGEYQNWEKYMFINTFCTHFDAMITLWYSYQLQECWKQQEVTRMLKTTLQRFGISKIAMCTFIYQSRSKCYITPLSFHIFVENCVWYDEDIGRIYQKKKKKYWPSFIFFLPT